MNGLVKRFMALSKKERNQVLVLTLCVVISSYMVVAVLMFENMFKVENLSNRKQNRIELRLGKFEIPEIKPGFTQKELNKINVVLEEKTQELQLFKERLMPMDRPKPRQQTKLEITYLAQKSNINVAQLETSHNEVPRSSSRKSTSDLEQFFSQRTVFNITAQAQYFDFINFVNSLSALPYLNYIKRLEVSPVQSTNNNDVQNEYGLLNIKFELQM
jgi:hypothetical protein